ncbi:MAG: hypothetical protein ACOCUP_01305 [bacterium]
MFLLIILRDFTHYFGEWGVGCNFYKVIRDLGYNFQNYHSHNNFYLWGINFSPQYNPVLMDYFYVVLFTILINIPFGYLRGDKKRFSFLWFLYIHIPVPFGILFRDKMVVELSWSFAPLYFGAYLLGQWLGMRYFKFRKGRV